ncbi:hypothetical protein DSO57_1018010 [Entomophthora muscae]|uniref:Uncharacterized protein n=1 Tax=Entomophthora muscae TaxID=34485 RepID=A0ACC2TFD6_9FUNG|nr:hypothetical protein DSO57_1018010 [Entomophthora muscae]
MGLFQIIKCYSCSTFQVHPAKKAKDWKCKLCGEKQSLKRIYFESSAAKDCRLQVQQLNLKRNRTPSPQPASEIPIPPVIINSDDSKWKKFKANQEEFQDIVDDDLFSNLEKLNSENKVSHMYQLA